MSGEKKTTPVASLGLDFATIFADVMAKERRSEIVEREYAKISEHVLLGYKRSKKLFGQPTRADPWIVVELALAKVNAYDFADLVPGHKSSKTIDYAGGKSWKWCRVVKLDDETKTKIADYDARLKTLRDERDAYLREKLSDLEPFTWDELLEATKREKNALLELKKFVGVS